MELKLDLSGNSGHLTAVPVVCLHTVRWPGGALGIQKMSAVQAESPRHANINV